MTTKHFIIATAGHVDHGKSTLVKALTGIDPDRLPEEKARGITIDLGFADLELSGSLVQAPSLLFKIGIVDVPGHEDFVKNMVAGVGSIDAALFVIAADDGWMPQTEEHLQILSYLGVRHAVIALTKIDLAVGKENLVIEHVRKKLEGSAFEKSQIIPTSAQQGIGVMELKKALASILQKTPSQPDIGKPRLPIDRVFTLHGIGTIVTGTLTGGTLRRGQEAIIQPSGCTTRIRTLQSYHREVQSSEPGTRTAINLPDVSVGSKSSGNGNPREVRRGHVLTSKELGNASRTMDVLLEKSPRFEKAFEKLGRPLKSGSLVRFHHCTGNSPARVVLMENNSLSAGERSFAQLRLEIPIFAFAGDHFILREWSEQSTLAGGIVLDPDAEIRNFHSQTRKNFLKQRSDASDQASAYILSELAYFGAVRRQGLLSKSRFGSLEIDDAISQLLKEKRAILAGDFLADPAWWQTLRQSAIDQIETHHRLHPEHSGLPLTQLRAKIDKKSKLPGLFEVLLTDLCKTDFSQMGDSIRSNRHRIALPPQLQDAGKKLRAALSAKPFEPPARKDLVQNPVSIQAMKFLLDTGEATKLSDDLIFLTEHLNHAIAIIRKFLMAHGRATAGDLRQALGTNRRVIIPLLEYLDRKGITLRQGDVRILKPTSRPC